VEFLMRASCLEWLSAPMCDEVFERSDSGEMLRLCERALMVIPIDPRSDTVRVHPLLRDVLYDTFERCDSTGRRELDLRASEWFEQAGDIENAIRLAVRSGQLERAACLVDDHAPAYLTAGEYSTVNRWLRSLATETMISSAPLCITASISALGSGDPAAAGQWLRFADEAVARGSRCEVDALHLESLRALVSPHADAQALAAARHAYEQLAPGAWHALACFGYGVLSLTLGDDETATAVLAEGATEARLIGAVSIEAQCLANQAVVVLASDDLARARSLVRSARALQREHHLDDHPALVMVTSMSALVAAMSGDVPSARADIAQSTRSLAHLAPLAGWANIQARITLAQANLLLDDRVAAQTLLDEVEPMLRDNLGAARSVEQFEHLAAQVRSGRTALPYGPSSLTAAELRVLPLLATNLTLAEIARRLFVSRNTAKSHAAAIYRKLGVSTRGEAVEVARSVGLLAGDAASPVDRRSPAPA
jgi:LuxR family maltose regulon positive regulatory protein